MYGSYKGNRLYVILTCKMPAVIGRMGYPPSYSSFYSNITLQYYIQYMHIYRDAYLIQPMNLAYISQGGHIPALHIQNAWNRLKRRWKWLFYSKRRQLERCALLKEELMMAAWHPRRVERWLDAGIEVEDM